MNKFGFTLAEVLITLGIIGVVAAMTLPALVSDYKGRVLQTQLAKSYSILQQALQQMQCDTGIIPNHANYGSATSSGTFMGTFRKYFINLVNCGYRGCVEQSFEDEEGNLQVNLTNRYRNYSNSSYTNSQLFDDGQMIMSDGMLLLVENYNSVIMVTIDVNGLYKKPNRWGHDLFTFQIEESSGKLLPMGKQGTRYVDTTSYCSVTSSNVYNGVACTYKALTDSDYFKNLPK